MSVDIGVEKPFLTKLIDSFLAKRKLRILMIKIFFVCTYLRFLCIQYMMLLLKFGTYVYFDETYYHINLR